ncbi:sensor domain-containing protein [Streptomyces hyaluromycini]|uniref:histidine kinase n=1 Tax=Streptomyces hyaluromycini TaxID=1377993 RepID=A0ABV1X4P3_9ACTN
MPGNPQTVWESMQGRRFLLGAWPWRALGYLLASVPLMLSAGAVIGALTLPWLRTWSQIVHGAHVPPGGMLASVLGGGVLFAVGAPPAAMPLAVAERRRLALVDTRPVRSGHRVPPRPGPRPWVRTRCREAATWREVAYAVLFVTVGPVAYLVVFGVAFLVAAFIAAPLLVHDDTPVALGFGSAGSVGDALWYALAGVVMLPAVPYLLALLAGAHGAVARALLGDGDEHRLRAELVEVARSRARLVDAFEAERRRIERDLHDGTQERLVSLTLRLGLARLDIAPGTQAYQNVTDAHEQAKQLMAELRELIRGIHPRVLTDRGLTAALGELADRSAIPVTVRTEPTDVTDRLPRHVETTAYFVATEALTNIAKHSRATAASITVRREGRTLTVEVLDDGIGGADPARGTGLTGLADRLAVVDGRILLSSPDGGPTLLRVELPCSQNDLRSG